MLQRILLAGAVAAAGFVFACGQPEGGATRALTQAQQSELKTFKGQLADPSRSPKTRLEAAELLLDRSYPQATEALLEFLRDSGNPTGQVAVAEAIARHGGDREAFIEPLMSLLTGPEPTVRVPAGRALAAYATYGVTERLIAVAASDKLDREIRLVAVGSLSSSLDKQAIEAMVLLLDDPDKGVAGAAGESLAKLTNIRTFGDDPSEWKAWWEENRNKKHSEWLGDVAERLNKAKTSLESENAQLRNRLARAMTDLYAALPEAQREGMLLSFLKDPLADVRLVGADLAARKVDANEPVSENIRSQIRSMLADADPRLRRSSALLLASLNDPKLLTALLDRLAIEQSSAVRQGLLTAVGQFGDPQVLPAVLREVPSRSPDVAAAAAEALGRIAENQPLEETTRADAAKALANRYREAAAEPDGEDLRESLLTAMGKLGEKKLSEVVAEGLTDRRATVRLAAVNALAKLGNESAAVLEPLVADNDRGVRQAAITAIGLLGGKDHLQTILARTDPSVEAEASVRQQAWDVTMNLLAGADVEALQAVAKGLSGRADAVNQRIVVLQKLADALATGEPVAHAEARRQLGAALLEAGRPAEAGTHLGNACRMYQGQEHPDASPVWREWINALLAADDPAAINAMKDQSNEKYFVASAYLLGARLSSLKADGKHSSLILLAEAALETLSGRLNAKQRQAIEKLLAEAKAARKAQDRLEVGKLVGQLQAADEAARKAAAAALKVLGDRAAGPLLRELRECISNSRPDGQLEAAIVAALGQVPVDMTGYDLAAPVADKIKLIDARLKSYQ